MSPAQRSSCPKEGAWQRCERIAHKQHGILTRAQALKAGLSSSAVDRKVASGEWVTVFPAVYRFRSAPDSWEGRLLAACFWGEADSVASHRSAAHLFGLEGVSDRILEVTGTAQMKVRGRKLIYHRTSYLPREDRTFFGPIPCTRVPRTLIDLGGVLGEQEVEIALDSALRKHRVTLTQLSRRLSVVGKKGRRGSATMRKLLRARTQSGVPPDSVFETILSRLIREAGLPPTRPQYHADDDSGLIGRIDFVYPVQKIAIEAHSYGFHTSPSQWKKDVERWNRLQAAGWIVILVTWDDVLNDRKKVVNRIREALIRSTSLLRDMNFAERG